MHTEHKDIHIYLHAWKYIQIQIDVNVKIDGYVYTNALDIDIKTN